MAEQVTTDTWQDEYPDVYDYHTFAPFYRELVRLAAGKFDPPSTVLDAGGGTGNLARRLRDRGNSVVVVDVSQQMLANARAKLGTEDVEYVQADLDAGLPVAPGSVDHVAALNVIYLLEQPEAFLEGARQLVAPGGRLVVSGPKPDADLLPLLRPVLRELVVERSLSVSDFAGLVKSFRLQSQITDQLGNGELNGLTERDWDRYLSEAGFTVREVEPVYEEQGLLVVADA
jgi:2-polyprenyl-3-methyl-5-hydroxy-6-metoxy-1,4-benzoquinol methylase